METNKEQDGINENTRQEDISNLKKYVNEHFKYADQDKLIKQHLLHQYPYEARR